MSTDPPPEQKRLFEELKQAVLERKPILRHILEKLGNKTLEEYVQGYTDISLHPLTRQRQGEFLQTVEDEISSLLGPAVAQSARSQLQQYFFVSTNDHHGPLNAFDFFNAHLVTSLHNMDHPEPGFRHIIALSCGSVSLNNITFPRGLTFHATGRAGLTTQRLSFLPSNAHASPVYGFRPYKSEEVTKVRTSLRAKVREGTVSEAVAERIDTFLTSVCASPSLLAQTSYSNQVTLLNAQLWDAVFKGKAHAPSLIYLEQEQLVMRLLTRHHLHAPTFLHRFLFDNTYETLIQKHFTDIYGAFARDRRWGTYLFWALPKGSKLRIQLWKEGEFLVAPDGSYRLPFQPDAIAAALERKELIPSLLLTFTVLVFYYGLKCLGGYSQVNYLTFMKEAFMHMQREAGDRESADACEQTSTKNWSGFTFAYLQNGGGTVTPATFLDLLLYENPEMWHALSAYRKELTLEEAVNPLMPEIYRYSYPETERRADLLTITEDDATRLSGLHPCLKARSEVRELSPTSI